MFGEELRAILSDILGSHNTLETQRRLVEFSRAVFMFMFPQPRQSITTHETTHGNTYNLCDCFANTWCVSPEVLVNAGLVSAKAC